MERSKLDDEITALFEGRDCFKNPSEEVCGPRRIMLREGGFFPPPLTHIGPRYAVADPRIFCLTINQNLKAVKGCSFNNARQCLRNAPANWYRPLDDFKRICQIIFKSLKKIEIDDERIRDFISFSNFVKCSSDQNKGNPTDRMIRNCTEFTMEEIQILRPDIVICMGSIPFEGIWRGIRNKYTRFLLSQDYDSYSFRFDMNGKIVKVIRLYHYGDMRTLNQIADYFEKCSQGKVVTRRFDVMNEFFEVAFGPNLHLHEYHGKLIEWAEHLKNDYRDLRAQPLLVRFMIHELVERALRD